MEWMSELARRIGMMLNRKRFRADLDDEMQLHMKLRQEQQAEEGMSEDEARYAARRRFGNATVLKEKSAAAWGWRWLDSLGAGCGVWGAGTAAQPGNHAGCVAVTGAGDWRDDGRFTR